MDDQPKIFGANDLRNSLETADPSIFLTRTCLAQCRLNADARCMRHCLAQMKEADEVIHGILDRMVRTDPR